VTGGCPVRAAGLVLKIFLILLPTILAIMNRFAGMVSISQVDFGVVEKYFIFQLLTVFLATALAGTLLSQVRPGPRAATSFVRMPCAVNTLMHGRRCELHVLMQWCFMPIHWGGPIWAWLGTFAVFAELSCWPPLLPLSRQACWCASPVSNTRTLPGKPSASTAARTWRYAVQPVVAVEMQRWHPLLAWGYTGRLVVGGHKARALSVSACLWVGKPLLHELPPSLLLVCVRVCVV
jgi:hypothetical protein